MASRYHPEPARVTHTPQPVRIGRNELRPDDPYLRNVCRCGSAIKRLPEQFVWQHTER